MISIIFGNASWVAWTLQNASLVLRAIISIALQAYSRTAYFTYKKKILFLKRNFTIYKEWQVKYCHAKTFSLKSLAFKRTIYLQSHIKHSSGSVHEGCYVLLLKDITSALLKQVYAFSDLSFAVNLQFEYWFVALP